VVVAALWNFQALGRSYAVLGSVGNLTQQAFQSLGSAQAALAEQDFAASETHFDNAQDSLHSARLQLDQAVAASEAVQQLLDVSGAVRSGDRLLAVGQSVTSAGQHLGRGMKHMQSAELVVGEDVVPVPLVDVLRDALAEFEEAHVRLVEAEQTLGDIPVSLLPGDVREQVQALETALPLAAAKLGAFVEQGDLMLAVLGAERERDYLLAFQNNHEMRATGGFLGSIGLVHVDRGTVEEIDVQTVYDPDGQLKEFIAPPPPLAAITDRWYMRDANWFIDYAVSAEKIGDFFEKEGGPTVDGVIALTPNVIQGMLELTGPIEMPAYEVTVTADNFTAVTQQEVTYFYDRELNRPKQFLADLTPVLLNRVLSGQQDDPLAVLSMFTELLHEKHLLLWLRDTDEAQRIAEIGWDASLPANEPGILGIVNSNIGGHKSDQFISQEVDYRTNVLADGSVEATVTIRRIHNGPAEALDIQYPPGENPAFKDNIVYQRMVVPAGSELVEASGFTPEREVPHHAFEEVPIELTADADVAAWLRVQREDPSVTVIGQEAGYTTFANWTVTKPGATSILFYKYRWPEPAKAPSFTDPATRHTVYVAKQPGDTRTEVRIDMRLPDGARLSHTVPQDGVTQSAANELVYRGSLRTDMLVGGVWTKE